MPSFYVALSEIISLLNFFFIDDLGDLCQGFGVKKIFDPTGSRGLFVTNSHFKCHIWREILNYCAETGA